MLHYASKSGLYMYVLIYIYKCGYSSDSITALSSAITKLCSKGRDNALKYRMIFTLTLHSNGSGPKQSLICNGFHNNQHTIGTLA